MTQNPSKAPGSAAGHPQFPKVCVVKDTVLTYSETFIGHHVRCLSAELCILSDFMYRSELKSRTMRFVNRVSLFLTNKSFLTKVKKKRFKEFLLKNNIDVVLAEFGPTGVIVRGVCEELGIPLVVHFHGYDASRFDVLRKNRKEYEHLFQAARKVIAVSKEMEGDLIALGADKRKIAFNSCGVDTDLFAPPADARRSETFLAVGRLVEKKSPDSTILAFSRIAEEFPSARLVVVGSGPSLSTCRRIVSDFKLESKVELRQNCPHDEVVRLMSEAGCFVQHSKTASNGDKEGTPVAILEASSAGLPVISTLHAGIKDAVIDGVTGLLGPEDDIERMAESMRKILRSPRLGSVMGKAGRQHVLKNYSHEVVDARLKEIVVSAWHESLAHEAGSVTKEIITASA